MLHTIRRTLPILLFAASTATTAISAHAQYYKSLYSLKGGSISAGYAGQFSTPLLNEPQSVTTNIRSAGGGFTSQTVSGQQQFTSDGGGLKVSAQLHPVPFAGIEFNYGFFRNSEFYKFNYSGTPALQILRVKASVQEATAAYVIHPKHIPLQPFLNVGGGALDFAPEQAQNQWRYTGLVETGIDLPTQSKHIAIRIEGRALIYHNPNFYQSAISSRGWRVTTEPVASVVYRF